MSNTGFECEFLKEPPQAFEHECPVCLLILRDPYQVTCCGYSFCLACIQRIKDDKIPCPLCKQEGFDDFPNKGLKRTLYQFKVYCSNKNSGCGWKGELGNLDNHLNTNSQPDKLFHGCEFTELKCSFCSEEMQRQYLQVHQTDLCNKRPVTCKYCNEYKSEFDDVVGNHWPVCPRYTLQCPNNCGAFPERQNMENHVTLDCPRTEINCEFHSVGCRMKFARDHMSSHLKDSISFHLSLTVESHSELTLSHANLSSSLTKLQAENHTLREKLQENKERNAEAIKELQECLSKEQQTNKQRTKQQTQELEGQRERHKNELDDIKRQITELRDRQNQEKRERNNETSNQDRTIHTLEKSLNGVRSEHEQLSSWINTPTLPFDFTMCNYFQHNTNQYKCWYSPTFYTRIHGYKMCLSVDANGSGTGKGTHVSVYVRMMHGEYDDFLRWPFRGDVTIQLLNQVGSEAHHTVVVHFNDQTEEKFSGRVTKGERCEHGWGSPTFIAHKELQRKSVRVGYTFLNREYLKNDCLRFRVQKVELK